MARRKRTKRKTNSIKNYYNFSQDELNALWKKKKYRAKVEWVKDKSEVRKTKEWLEMKCYVAHKQDDKDYLTGQPLTKGANLHHLDYHDENYGDFNSDNFVLLNTMSHKCVHFILALMHKLGEEEVFDRLHFLFERTKKLNSDIKTWKQAH